MTVSIERVEDRLRELHEKVTTLDEIVNGRDGDFGIAHQVKILWRVHVWLLCTASAALGAVATWLLNYVWR